MLQDFPTDPSSILIPTVIESEGRIERAYDIYSRLLKDRIVILGEDVNPHTANLIVAQLLFLDNEDNKKPIHLYINSPGGTVSDGLGIYDTMQFISSPVYTYGLGLQASMGAFLLSSGEKGHRFMLPNARAMIHQPSSGTRGKVTDMEIDLKESLRIKHLLNEILARNTGQPIKKIEVDVDRDYWMSAEEAKKYGLIDAVLKKL